MSGSPEWDGLCEVSSTFGEGRDDLGRDDARSRIRDIGQFNLDRKKLCDERPDAADDLCLLSPIMETRERLSHWSQYPGSISQAHDIPQKQ